MYKNSILKNFSIILLLIIVAISCDSSDTSTPELEASLLSTASIDGYSIELFSENDLRTGYNNLYWKVSKDGEVIELDSFSAMPIMHMTQMSHSCPYTSPEKMADYTDYYQSSANFIMPSGEMGYWEVQIEFTTKSDEAISGEIDIDVESSWMLTSTQSNNGNVYFISWYAPETPKTGNQDLTFMIHKRESMMSFPAVSDAELEVYPYMDMGGGEGHSTPFETPEAIGSGMYEGSINYSMSGTWTTTVKVITETDTTSAVTFEYSVIAK